MSALRTFAVYAHGVQGWGGFEPSAGGQSPADQSLSRDFTGSAPDEERYQRLFRYFVAGAVEARDGSRLRYRGYPSTHGYSVAGLEGFARTAPLLGAWVHSGRSDRIPLGTADGRSVELVAFLRRAVLAGTDPSGGGYWGDMVTNDQRIVEAADVARMLWLTRSFIWTKLTDAQRRQIVRWLTQVNRARVKGRKNNWLLFPVVVNAFLKSVDQNSSPDYRTYYEFKTGSYRESGLFSDGPKGPVDYYNAWGISYDLFWIHLMDPALDPAFIRSALLDSGRLSAHLISPRGIPILGRSLCYRTAVPSPIVAASHLFPQQVSPGMARRAVDATWRYFVGRGALKESALTMGYFADDPRLIDNYSGPGSCHWGLRSLTLAFMNSPTHPFWTARMQPLPVERGDYRLVFRRLGWSVSGEKQTLDIAVEPAGGRLGRTSLTPYSVRRRAVEGFFERPCRPANKQVKYQLKRYSAVQPLGGLIEAKPSPGAALLANIQPPWGCGFNVLAGI